MLSEAFARARSECRPCSLRLSPLLFRGYYRFQINSPLCHEFPSFLISRFERRMTALSVKLILSENGACRKVQFLLLRTNPPYLQGTIFSGRPFLPHRSVKPQRTESSRQSSCPHYCEKNKKIPIASGIFIPKPIAYKSSGIPPLTA